MRNGSGYTGLCNGLSRMKGNFHVRFLGEGVVATPLPYPTQGHRKTAEPLPVQPGDFLGGRVNLRPASAW